MAAANYQSPFQNGLLNQHYSQAQQPTYDFGQAGGIYKPQVLTRLHRNVRHRPHHHHHEKANINNNADHSRLNLAQLLNDDPPPPPPVPPKTTSSTNGQQARPGNSRTKLLKLDGVESSPSMNSMLRNIQPAHQLILADNSYPAAAGLPASSVAAAMAAINGAVENPTVAMNLVDSADVLDEHGGGGGGGTANGHFDYAYHSPPRLEHHQAPSFTTISGITNLNNNANNQSSTMALYRLLNLIDQSVPAISMPFSNSKTSSATQQTLVGGGGDGGAGGLGSAFNFDDSNGNYNQSGAGRSLFNYNNLDSHRHQTLASQQTSSSPNPNYWSRKRNQMHWRQANQHSAADYGGGGGDSTTSGGGDGQTAKQQSSLIDNSIDVQPAALKLIKASQQSSYLNTPTTPTNSRRANHSQSSYHNNINNFYQQHNGHGHGQQNTNINNNNNNNLSSQAIGTRNNNLNLNSMKNDDIGFGSKQQQTNNNNNHNNNNSNSNYNSERLNGALVSSSSSNSKVPHDADSEMIAANNAPRCDKFTPDICVDDFEYPEQAIIEEIQKKRDVFELMYSEVKDNEPLVDGIPRDVEESYNYDYYYYGKTNLTQAASQPSPTSSSSSGSSVGAGLRLIPSSASLANRNKQRSTTSAVGEQSTSEGGNSAAALDDLDGPLASSISAAASSIDGMDALIGATPQASNPSASSQSPPTTGFICPSEVMYGKPKLAKNKKGLWKVIVNAGEFTQTVRLEKCLLPNKKCNYVSAQNYESRCAQVHSYHRLLVFEKGRGFYIDTFRLPTGCNCHVTRKSFMPSASGGRRESSSSSSGSESSGTRQQPQNDPPASSSASSSPGNNQLPFYQFGGRTGAPNNERSSSESMLSQTLWSILSGGGNGNGGQLSQSFNLHSQFDGGGGGGASSSGNPNRNPNVYSGNSNSYLDSSSNTNNLFERPAQREAYQSQSLILEHLSQNPGLAANISDSVLRQLIDVGQINTNPNYQSQNQQPNGAASQPFSVAPQPVSAATMGMNNNANNNNVADVRQPHRGAQMDCGLCEQNYHDQRLGGQHYSAATMAAQQQQQQQQQPYNCANACARAAPFAHARQHPPYK